MTATPLVQALVPAAPRAPAAQAAAPGAADADFGAELARASARVDDRSADAPADSATGPSADATAGDAPDAAAPPGATPDAAATPDSGRVVATPATPLAEWVAALLHAAPRDGTEADGSAAPGDTGTSLPAGPTSTAAGHPAQGAALHAGTARGAAGRAEPAVDPTADRAAGARVEHVTKRVGDRSNSAVREARAAGSGPAGPGPSTPEPASAAARRDGGAAAGPEPAAARLPEPAASTFSAPGGSAAGMTPTEGAACAVLAARVTGAADTAPAEAHVAATPGTPQFAPAIGHRIAVFARDGVDEARVHLNPAEMGPVAVQLAVDGTQVRVQLVAEHAATRQALEQALPTLAGALREAGLTLAGGGVFQQSPQQGGGDSQAQAQGRAPAGGVLTAAAETADDAASTGHSAQVDALVDLFA
jgi:flagellar hook-length control protein FliK